MRVDSSVCNEPAIGSLRSVGMPVVGEGDGRLREGFGEARISYGVSAGNRAGTLYDGGAGWPDTPAAVAAGAGEAACSR